MSGTEIFAVVFMAVMFIGLPLLVFIEYGGLDPIVKWMIRLIDRYNNKKKDI
jgi:hypothetical protein